MPVSTLAGHPLHPQLVGFPLSLLPTTLALDVLALATGRDSYRQAAWYTLVAASAGGAAAAAAGATDYFSLERGSHSRSIANLHAALNVGVLGVTGVNLLLRRRSGGRAAPLPALLSLLGTTGALVSAWYGGHMVYAHGMRVRGVSEVEDAPELKPPLDDRLVTAFDRLQERLVRSGPHRGGAMGHGGHAGNDEGRKQGAAEAGAGEHDAGSHPHAHTTHEGAGGAGSDRTRQHPGSH